MTEEPASNAGQPAPTSRLSQTSADDDAGVPETSGGDPSHAAPAPTTPEQASEDADDTGGPDEAASSQQKQTERPEIKYIHSTNFPDLMEQWGGSLLVSTYQAWRLMLVRAREGRLNTLLRLFRHPMGIACRPGTFALGSKREIWLFQNAPQIGGQLNPERRYDACFIPRRSHITGDIRVHELAWCANELWFVNTRFSCLCSLSDDYCFLPRWWPPFVSEIVPEDRCHLNGVAVAEGRPRFVTAHGRSNESQGWRENKNHGGCVIDVDSGELLVSGLAMPHSPRLVHGRLWFLDSGNGTLVVCDPETGRTNTVAGVPGFARGLAFAGRHALVAASRPREKSVFQGAPIARKLKETRCGVYAIHLQSGRMDGFIEFQSGCNEIFDIQFIPRLRFPEIVGLRRETLDSIFLMPPIKNKGASKPNARTT